MIQKKPSHFSVVQVKVCISALGAAVGILLAVATTAISAATLSKRNCNITEAISLETEEKENSLLVDTGNYAQAVARLKKIKECHQLNYETLVLLGKGYQGVNAISSAKQNYLEALRLNKRGTSALRALGSVYGREGNLKKAIEQYSLAIEIDPKDFKSYSDRGVAKGALGQLNESINDFNKSIEINPRYADAYRNRGIAKEAMKDMTGACSDWSIAKALGQDGPALWHDAQCKRNIVK